MRIGNILSFLCLVTLTAALIGCADRKKAARDDSTLITLDLSGDPTNIHHSGLFGDMELLSLQTDDFLIGTVDKVLRNGDYLYIFDDKQQAVGIYDTKGNFVNGIRRRGRGPNEYIQLSDIFIDNDGTTLCLLSRIDQKIFKFEPDGSFRSVTKIDTPYASICSTGSGYAGSMDNTTYHKDHPVNLWIMDGSFERLDGYLPIDMKWLSRSLSSCFPFSSYGGTAYYTEQIGYDIFGIEGQKVSLRYKFDLGKYSLPSSARELTPDEFIEFERLNPEIVSHFRGFQETDKYLIFTFSFNNQTVVAFYDKATGESTLCSLNSYEDKYLLGFGEIISIDEKAIYAVKTAADIKRMQIGRDQYNDFLETHPEQVKRLREDFPTVDGSGNPFLAIYYFN